MRQKSGIIFLWTLIIIFFCFIVSYAFPPTPPVNGLSSASNVNITGGNETLTNLNVANVANVTNQQWGNVTIQVASNTDLGSVNGTFISANGDNTTITDWGNLTVGRVAFVRFLGTNNVLTYNATKFITPGSRSYTVNANDRMTLVSLGGGNWFVRELLKANGYATGRRIFSSYTTTSNVKLEDMYGVVLAINGAANLTVTLPTVVSGMGAEAYCANADCCIDVQATDIWNVAGSNLTAGNKICSTCGAGSRVSFESSANGVITIKYTNCTFIDGGA